MQSSEKNRIQNIIFTILIVYVQGFVIAAVQPVHKMVNIYIYFMPILFLPIRTPRHFVLLAALGLGLLIDIIMDTLGLFMIAALWVGFFRIRYLSYMIPEKKLQLVKDQKIGLHIVPLSIFLVYVLMLCGLHNIIVILLETFTTTFNYYLMLKWFLDTLYSVIVFMLVYFIYYRSTK